MPGSEYFTHVLDGVTSCELEVTRAQLGLALANCLPSVLDLARRHHPERQVVLSMTFTLPDRHCCEAVGRVGEIGALVQSLIQGTAMAVRTLTPNTAIRATLRARLGPQVSLWKRVLHRYRCKTAALAEPRG